jgi:hypothetical protein
MLSGHQCCGGCNGGFVMVAGELPGYSRLELSGGVMANPAAGYVLVYTPAREVRGVFFSRGG